MPLSMISFFQILSTYNRLKLEITLILFWRPLLAISFCIRTVCTSILQCLQELTNSRHQIVSPEFYVLYIQDYCILRRIACEQAPVGDSRVRSANRLPLEIVECSLGRAGWIDSGLVWRECAGEPVDIPLMPPFHDTSSWYQDLIGWIDDCWQLWDK